MRMRESAGVSHTHNFARRFSVPHTDWQQLDSVPSQVPNSSLPWVTDMRTVAQYGFTGACADAAEAKALFDESCRAVETWLTSKGVANPNGNSTSEFQDGRTADFEAACQTCSFGAASRWALTESSGPSRFSTTLRLARARTALLRGVWRCVPWRLPETRHGQRVVSQSRPSRFGIFTGSGLVEPRLRALRGLLACPRRRDADQPNVARRPSCPPLGSGALRRG